MFDSGIIPPFEHTVGESLRVARCVYGRLLFSWPSREDAAAFRKLFPLMLKISNSHPVMLKVYVDRFKVFTAAKVAGAPTLSIRNVPLEFDPEDIRASLLGTTDEDGALTDPTDFHRASDPYEDTFFTHLAGLLVATPDDPNFERIPSEILLESNKPAMLLNFSCHVCSLCGNNHRASDHEAFAARRRGRLTNKNTISIAQLQTDPGPPTHSHPTRTLPLLSPPPRRPHFLTEPLALFPSNTPPTLGAFPPKVSPEDGPAAHPHAGTETLPSPSLSPLFLTAPSPTSPTPRLLPSPPSLPIPLLSFPPTLNPAFPTPPHSFHPPPSQGPNCNRPQRSDWAARPPTPLGSPPLGPPPHLPHLPHPSNSPCPPYSCTSVCPPAPPCSPLLPPTAPSLAGNLLGTHAAPTAFRNDPGLLYIGLDDWVEYWTCALCDFTCGAALDSAMEHIQSYLHATRVKASAHRPAAKDDFGPWRALTLLQQKAPVTAFLRGRP
ncbi:unnamed protein product [Closterium sp. NIES-64]|nr:unnamed protein product [Closterium sp. NIES-64]